ncbi:MAG TPA: hypothetical protein VLC55_14440 [Burkholderiales bacterium]|nr:hypothetical protein [Burkholderiales bacterium]
MTQQEWYEVRVAGSAGTTLGIEAGMREGKAVGDAGRVVTLASGQARHFATVKEAQDFLLNTSVVQVYQMEVVHCTETSADPVQS